MVQSWCSNSMLQHRLTFTNYIVWMTTQWADIKSTSPDSGHNKIHCHCWFPCYYKWICLCMTDLILFMPESCHILIAEQQCQGPVLIYEGHIFKYGNFYHKNQMAMILSYLYNVYIFIYETVQMEQAERGKAYHIHLLIKTCISNHHGITIFIH